MLLNQNLIKKNDNTGLPFMIIENFDDFCVDDKDGADGDCVDKDG